VVSVRAHGISVSAGNFGDVFLGSWNGTAVALKRLKDSDALDFQREAKTLLLVTLNLRH
jgi:predicted Ser/Thr protein kinase